MGKGRVNSKNGGAQIGCYANPSMRRRKFKTKPVVPARVAKIPVDRFWLIILKYQELPHPPGITGPTYYTQAATKGEARAKVKDHIRLKQTHLAAVIPSGSLMIEFPQEPKGAIVIP